MSFCTTKVNSKDLLTCNSCLNVLGMLGFAKEPCEHPSDSLLLGIECGRLFVTPKAQNGSWVDNNFLFLPNTFQT